MALLITIPTDNKIVGVFTGKDCWEKFNTWWNTHSEEYDQCWIDLHLDDPEVLFGQKPFPIIKNGYYYMTSIVENP